MKSKKLVEEWDKGSRYDKGSAISLRIISKINNINFNSFRKYSCSDTAKNRLIGTRVGSKISLLEENYDRLFGGSIWPDCENCGLASAKVIDWMQELHTDI